MVEQEPESGLREVVHQRVRLGVLAVLDRRGPCTFSQLRDALGQRDGSLGRHLGVLEEHGYITTEKVFENRRPKTWVRMTEAGAEAFREEQELLAKLLATASDEAGGTEDNTAAMAIVFAALLADTEAEEQGADPLPDRDDRSDLVPAISALTGRPAESLLSGPISARYDFPQGGAGFAEQREQRLMFVSHGLRGGWITTWHLPDPEQSDGQDLAHAMVVELGGAANCAAILAAMGPPTVDIPGVPAARGYLVTADGAPATAVAWFAVGPYLASTVVIAPADAAIPLLRDLATEVHHCLALRQP